MRWSQMNSAQRAFLSNGAKFARDTIVNGKVIKRGEPMNNLAMVMVAAKALDADHDRKAKLASRQAMLNALAVFTPGEISALATKLPAGKAYGSGALNRRRTTAMPMNFYAGSGYGG